jgi:ABC-type glutathione transport system ATPase component
MATTAPAPSSAGASSDIVLSIRDLEVHFPTSDGVVKAVNGLTFDLARGKTLGIVGESGSGKSVSSSAILALHDPKRTRVSGEIWLNGVDLLTLDEDEMARPALAAAAILVLVAGAAVVHTRQLDARNAYASVISSAAPPSVESSARLSSTPDGDATINYILSH